MVAGLPLGYRLAFSALLASLPSEHSAGLGGFVRPPCGKCLHIFPSRAACHVSVVPARCLSLALHLLAQCGLLHLLSCLRQLCFRCRRKALSLAKGLCALLRSFFIMQERQFISVHIDLPFGAGSFQISGECWPALPCRVKRSPENFGVLRSSMFSARHLRCFPFQPIGFCFPPM